MRQGRRWGSVLCLLAHFVGPAGLPGVARAEDAPVAPAPVTDAEPDSMGAGSRLAGKEGGSTWGVIGSAAGILAGAGLAVWVKSEADERYDLYLETADPAAAAEFLDSAERYDRAALVGFAVAQVSFVALVYFLTREDDRELVPIRGEPVVRFSSHGAEVGVRFRP